MPHQEPVAPVRRPEFTERTVSAQSLSKGSPSGGLATTHKGSSNKLHKVHAGQHRAHPHARIPSHGKNQNRHSRLGPGNPEEDTLDLQTHRRSLSTTPPLSLGLHENKHNAEPASLPRTESRASLKNNTSNISLKRNGSSKRLSGHKKSEKSQIKSQLRQDISNDAPTHGGAHFSVGGDGGDDDWTEASSSQSPETTRRSSIAFKTPQPPQTTSPRKISGIPSKLPQSPPQSPTMNGSDERISLDKQHQIHDLPDPHHPDVAQLTKRLLNRNGSHNPPPQFSSVSATVASQGATESPDFDHSKDSTLHSDPSMPADGISRFLNHSASSSGNATPGSVSQHIQSTLANMHRSHQNQQPPTHSSNSPPTHGNLEKSRRARSMGNLKAPNHSNEEDRSLSPSHRTPHQQPSAFESHRAIGEPGKSLTQLKLDLQRMSINQEANQTAPVQPNLPLVHGAHAMAAIGGEGTPERRVKQWKQADLEYKNSRRFQNMIVAGVQRLEKRGLVKKPRRSGARDSGRDGGRDGGKSHEASPLSQGMVSRPSGPSRSASTGKVRFEVGEREGGEPRAEEGESEETELEGLLTRMWNDNSGMEGEAD